MTPFDHEEGEMRGFPLDEKVASALVDGKVVADDAPPGYEHVARLVRAATAPPSADELAGQDQVVATLAAAVGEAKGVSVATHGRRRPMLTKLLTVKMAAAATAALFGGGAAAAATGSLPTSLQTKVSHDLSHVGISVPDPLVHTEGAAGSAPTVTNSTGTTTTTSTSTTTTTTTTPTSAPSQAVGPSVPGPALEGLCTAYAASSGSQADGHSVAFRNLAAAAAAKGDTVADYCAAMTPPSTAGGTPTPPVPSDTTTPGDQTTEPTEQSSAGHEPTNPGDQTTEPTEQSSAGHSSSAGDHGTTTTTTTTTTGSSTDSSTGHASAGDAPGASSHGGGAGQGGGDGGADS